MTELLSLEVAPDHAQVVVCDEALTEVPQFGSGSEPATANDSGVLIPTRPEHEGPVSIRVTRDTDDAPDGQETYAGELSLRSGRLQVGSLLSGELAGIEVDGRATIRILVDRPGHASQVHVVLT